MTHAFWFSLYLYTFSLIAILTFQRWTWRTNTCTLLSTLLCFDTCFPFGTLESAIRFLTVRVNSSKKANTTQFSTTEHAFCQTTTILVTFWQAFGEYTSIFAGTCGFVFTELIFSVGTLTLIIA